MMMNLARIAPLLSSGDRPEPAPAPSARTLAILRAATKGATPIIRPQDAVSPDLNPQGEFPVARWTPAPSPTPSPVPNAGLFGAAAPLPTDPGEVEPGLLPGTDLPDEGNVAEAPPQNINEWLAGALPGGAITSFGRNPVTGNAPPTAVPTFCGPGLGNAPIDVAAGGRYGGGSALPVLAQKSGHRASWWVF